MDGQQAADRRGALEGGYDEGGLGRLARLRRRCDATGGRGLAGARRTGGRRARAADEGNAGGPRGCRGGRAWTWAWAGGRVGRRRVVRSGQSREPGGQRAAGGKAGGAKITVANTPRPPKRPEPQHQRPPCVALPATSPERPPFARPLDPRLVRP